jgi:hypothetical protein
MLYVAASVLEMEAATTAGEVDASVYTEKVEKILRRYSSDLAAKWKTEQELQAAQR